MEPLAEGVTAGREAVLPGGEEAGQAADLLQEEEEEEVGVDWLPVWCFGTPLPFLPQGLTSKSKKIVKGSSWMYFFLK
jgi:hypothetical protein